MFYGDKKASGQLLLENSPENFQRGRTDVFTQDLPDLGSINRCVIGHNEKGHCPRWHLDRVIIQNKTVPGSAQVVFWCGKWFARDLEDNQVVRTLTLGPKEALNKKYKVGFGSRMC